MTIIKYFFFFKFYRVAVWRSSWLEPNEQIYCITNWQTCPLGSRDQVVQVRTRATSTESSTSLGYRTPRVHTPVTPYPPRTPSARMLLTAVPLSPPPLGPAVVCRSVRRVRQLVYECRRARRTISSYRRTPSPGRLRAPIAIHIPYNTVPYAAYTTCGMYVNTCFNTPRYTPSFPSRPSPSWAGGRGGGEGSPNRRSRTYTYYNLSTY